MHSWSFDAEPCTHSLCLARLPSVFCRPAPPELPFSEGDVMLVLEDAVPGSPGWCRCRLGAADGLVPLNYVRLSRRTYVNVPTLPAPAGYVNLQPGALAPPADPSP